MSAHSGEYAAHLRSPDWARMRRDRIIETRWRCEGCGQLAYDLELHHETYDRLGTERPRDLRLLCSVCHRRADAERRKRASAAQWAARVDGWARCVYGDEWNLDHDPDEVGEQFKDWLACGGEA